MTLPLDPYPIAGRMHLPTKAYVKPISDGRYTIIGPMIAGIWFDMGPAVGLSNGDVDVSVISGMMQAFDNGQMRVVGFDPRQYRIVVVKSANRFRAWWADVASAIIDRDPPGDTSVLTRLKLNLNVIMKDGVIYKNTLG